MQPGIAMTLLTGSLVLRQPTQHYQTKQKDGYSHSLSLSLSLFLSGMTQFRCRFFLFAKHSIRFANIPTTRLSEGLLGHQGQQALPGEEALKRWMTMT